MQTNIFEGKMNAILYGNILQQALIPFINEVYPEGHKTPPESPDFNPIENLWHELKEYMRREVKPRTKDELISGIEEFWSTINKDKCRKYIRHLRKVLPRAIEVNGDATGY